MLCQWQKELLEHKRALSSNLIFKLSNKLSDDEEEFKKEEELFIKTCNLPNMHIKLGLRTTNVKVGDWIPPHPMFLEELKSMCFPLNLEEFKLDGNMKDFLTNWYKIFETIHFFEDLNGRLGGIVVAILSFQ